MIFIMHLSILLAYSVLLASTVLFIWSFRNKGEGTTLGKTIGSVIFILSLLSVLCTSYYGVKYWKQGNFETPLGTSQTMQQKNMRQMRQNIIKKMMEMKNTKNLQEKGSAETTIPSKPDKEIK